MQLTPNPLSGAPPFRLQTAPAEAFAHPSWRQVRAGALEALNAGGAVAVLGRPGTGKTLLLQSLAEALRAEGKRVRTLGHGEAVPDQADCDVLLVDEGGTLSDAILTRLCRSPAPFVLAGMPEFAPRLEACPRRIATFQLEALATEDVARFVAARLSATGRARDTFEADAVLALARHSGGLMRLITVLASAALFFAEQEGAGRVTRHHVDEAAAMREVMQEEPAVAPAAAVAPEQIAPEAVAAEPASLPAEMADFVIAADDPAVSVPTRPNRQWALGGAAAGLIGLVLAVAIGWSMAGGPAKPSSHPPTPARVAERPIPPAPPEPAPAPPASAAAPAAAQVIQAPPPPAPTAQVVQVRPPPVPPHLAVAAPPPPPRPPAPPPRPAPVAADAAADLAFHGPIMNETMGQGGQLALALRTQGGPGPVTAHFHAYAGLIGTGELTGTMSPDGRLSLSGRLMMGRNPFDCTLSGTVEGGRLTGSATFIRAGGGTTAQSSFTLSRS